MSYHQLTREERYQLQALRGIGLSRGDLARQLGRHRSTVWRELRRNRTRRGAYEPHPAHGQALQRRSCSRRNRRVTAAMWREVVRLLQARWSPDQIAGRGGEEGRLRISRATIYLHLLLDRAAGGELYRLLRGSRKRRRRRPGSARRRGPLGPSLGTRPGQVAQRRRIGDWEIDTMVGPGRACIVTLVERKTGYLRIGKLRERTAAAFAERTLRLLRGHPRRIHTITADNGPELTDYRRIERITGVKFYFATPYHAWERGTNENTNGLIREYLPKGTSMARLTQPDCNAIARRLNQRPRQRLAYRTPEECYER